jgi:hypothetical protein
MEGGSEFGTFTNMAFLEGLFPYLYCQMTACLIH